jgi:hypothetical protein
VTTKRTVWAVTDGEYGEYSDYRIKALFETKEAADAARKSGLGDNVDEMPYYPAGVPGPRKHSYWLAFATRRDDEMWVEGHHYREDDWDCDEPPVRRPRVFMHETGSWASMRVVARTEEAAIKVRADKIAQLNAAAIEAAS